LCSGFISFTHNGEKRSLFYYKSNINTYENLEYYKPDGLEEMVKLETTALSFGCWGSSVEIMREIVSYFGGWVDENDYDDKPFYELQKSDDGSVKPIRYVTMEEVCEMFGEKVIIRKER
jgi:hypothetical protein